MNGVHEGRENWGGLWDGTMSGSLMMELICGWSMDGGILFDGILECKYCLYSLISIQFGGSVNKISWGGIGRKQYKEIGKGRQLPSS